MHWSVDLALWLALNLLFYTIYTGLNAVLFCCIVCILIHPSLGAIGWPFRFLFQWMVRRYVSKETLLEAWQYVSGEHHIQLVTSSPYIYLRGLRRIDDTYYVQNKFNAWVRASTPCRGEDGISVVQIDIDGVKSTLLQPNGKPCSRDEWVDLFGVWNDTFSCYFYKNRHPSTSEKLSFKESDFDHCPREGAKETDCNMRIWIRSQ